MPKTNIRNQHLIVYLPNTTAVRKQTQLVSSPAYSSGRTVAVVWIVKESHFNFGTRDGLGRSWKFLFCTRPRDIT